MLIGVPGGWAALTESGGYTYEGEVTGEFWQSSARRGFAPGELDPYLPEAFRLPPDSIL
jgi:hypothetical protein